MPVPEIKARVRKFGMFQQLTFRLAVEARGDKQVYFYATDKNVEESELLRLANQFGAPFIAKNASAYPSGKASLDFVLEPGQPETSQ